MCQTKPWKLVEIFKTRWWQLKYFLFSSLLGEDSHFDEHIFQMSWFNHQLRKLVALLTRWNFGSLKVQNGSKGVCFFTHKKQSHQKLNGTESQRTADQVSCDRKSHLDTQGFFGVRETWLLLEISWNKSLEVFISWWNFWKFCFFLLFKNAVKNTYLPPHNVGPPPRQGWRIFDRRWLSTTDSCNLWAPERVKWRKGAHNFFASNDDYYPLVLIL